MALDSAVLAQTANPPSPLEMLARVQQIRNAQQQQQLGAQQIQAETLKNQQTQLDMQDQQNFRQAYMQANGDPEQALKIASQKGVSPKTAVAFQQQIMGLAKTRAQLDNTQMDVLQKKHDAFNSLLQPVEDAAADPAKQEALFNAAKQQAIEQKLVTPEEAQQVQYAGPASVHALRAGLNTEKFITAQAAQMKAQDDRTKTNAEVPGITAKSNAAQLGLVAQQIDGVKDQAGYRALVGQLPPAVASQLPPNFDPATTPALIKRMAVPAEQQPNYDIENAKAKAITALGANPQAAVAQIDQILPPNVPGNADVNRAYKTLLTGAIARGDLETAKNAINLAAEHAARISAETNPQVINARVNQAVATARATAPIEIQKEVDKQVAIAKNSPDAFGAISDPRSRASAQAAYRKDSDEYADKIGAAQQFADFISAAQSGNKAAPGLVPIADLRSIVNRVNRQELQSVSSGAGSLLDRVQGKLNGLTEGQPIPPAVLGDMQKLSTLMQQSADRTYRYKIGVTNQTYGSKAQPVDLSAVLSPTKATPSYKAGDTRTIKGVNYTRDAAGNWQAK